MLRKLSTTSYDFFAANANRAFEHYQAELARAWEAAAAKETASETRSEHIENMAMGRNVSSYEGVFVMDVTCQPRIILGYICIAEA